MDWKKMKTDGIKHDSKIMKMKDKWNHWPQQWGNILLPGNEQDSSTFSQQILEI